jgi:hypothetical protein
MQPELQVTYYYLTQTVNGPLGLIRWTSHDQWRGAGRFSSYSCALAAVWVVWQGGLSKATLACLALRGRDNSNDAVSASQWQRVLSNIIKASPVTGTNCRRSRTLF